MWQFHVLDKSVWVLQDLDEQVRFGDAFSDAKRNLLVSMAVAPILDIPEVFHQNYYTHASLLLV